MFLGIRQATTAHIMRNSNARSVIENAATPRRCFPRWVGWAAGTMLMVAIASELASRVWLGLGDPPLSIADADIEYLSKPGTYRRFGNRMFINAHHMRSEEFPAKKRSPDEVRIMVIGDSVVHGGGLTDQTDLATECMQATLREQLRKPVVVGNIAAGSWGPGNQLAYARRFGLFDADIVLIVSHGKDVGDNPTGKPVVGVDPSFPSNAPVLALEEAIGRYLIPKLERLTGRGISPTPGADVADEKAAADRSMQDLGALCDLARASGATVFLAYFPQRHELDGQPLPGHAALAEFAAGRKIEFIDLREAFSRASAQEADPYRPNDTIHPSGSGQRVLCDAVVPFLRDALAGNETVEP